MSADKSYFGLKLLAASMLLSFVGGCGGGGGGGSPDTGTGSGNNVNNENSEPEYIPPPDLTAPNVVAMTPAEDSAGIATNSRLTVTFSEAMTPSDIDTRNFRLTDGVEAISGTVSFDSTNNIAKFTPTAALAPNTRYTATVVTGIKDLAGNALTKDFAWCFTTDIDAAEDRIAPTMTSTLPANALTGVPFNRKISATFSEAMNSSLLTPANFKLVGSGATAVAGTVTYVDTTAIFTPASALAANTAYTATITAGVTDLAGNAVGAGQSWAFTTGANADSTAPGVLSTIPANTASDVAISSAIKVTF